MGHIHHHHNAYHTQNGNSETEWRKKYDTKKEKEGESKRKPLILYEKKPIKTLTL